MAIERLKTGIKGFDSLVEGGIPRGYQIMITGLPGTGKTIFMLETLYRGAVELKEPSLYVAIGEDSEKVIKDQASRFGWDLDKAKNFKFLVLPVNKTSYDIVEEIKKAAKAIGAKRIGIDSLSSLSINSVFFSRGMIADMMKTMGDLASETLDTNRANEGAVQRFIYLFVAGMQETGATLFYVTDSTPNGQSGDGVSEFVGDGLILLGSATIGKNVNRTLEVKKLRSTEITGGKLNLTFTKNGLYIG